MRSGLATVRQNLKCACKARPISKFWPRAGAFFLPCAPHAVSSLEKLLNETRRRLWSMFNFGTTTAEVKTGYGLRTATELRMLQALIMLDKEGPLEIVPTFLGAHAIAPEYREHPDEYTDLICCTMLPLLKEWWPHNAPYHAMPFVDVFCETGAFTLQQSRAILTRPTRWVSRLKSMPMSSITWAGPAWRLSWMRCRPTTW